MPKSASRRRGRARSRPWRTRASPRPTSSARSASGATRRRYRSTRARSGMKARTRNILLIGGGVLLLAGIVVANVARGGGGTTAVQAADVKRGKIAATVRAPGRIQPVTQVKLSANVPGEVVRLAVKEGDVVRKGQFLLQLDDTQVRSLVRQSQAAIEAARSNLRLAQASYAQSSAALKRKEELFTRKLVSPEEVETARTQASTDKARVDANQEEIQRATATLAGAEDQLRKTTF